MLKKIFWICIMIITWFVHGFSVSQKMTQPIIQTPSLEQVIIQKLEPEPKPEPKFSDIGVLKIMNAYNKKLNDTEKEKYLSAIFYWSRMYDLDPKLVASIIARESSYRSNLSNSYGAIGSMQVVYRLWKKKLNKIGISDDSELFNIDKNIQAGCFILKTFLKWHRGDLRKALRAYSGTGKNKSDWYYESVVRIMSRANERV